MNVYNPIFWYKFHIKYKCITVFEKMTASQAYIALIILSQPNLNLTIIDGLLGHQSLSLVFKWWFHYINRCQHRSINHIELKSLLQIKSHLIMCNRMREIMTDQIVIWTRVPWISSQVLYLLNCLVLVIKTLLPSHT